MFFRIFVRLGKRAAGIHVKKVILKKSQLFNLAGIHHYSSVISWYCVWKCSFFGHPMNVGLLNINLTGDKTISLPLKNTSACAHSFFLSACNSKLKVILQQHGSSLWSSHFLVTMDSEEWLSIHGRLNKMDMYHVIWQKCGYKSSYWPLSWVGSVFYDLCNH